MLICPNCSTDLTKQDACFKCVNGHSFDIASSGYCNLLISTKSGDFKGDTKEMVIARRNFLDSGTYEPLQNAVCKSAAALSPSVIVDAGCGEGYYTRAVADTLPNTCIIGADIAKSATQYASKRDKRTQYITASCFHLPIKSESTDLVLSLFAPSAAEEFLRILKPDGHVLQVVPGADHLIELKTAVYDKVYKNREEKYSLDGFELIDRQKLSYSKTICSNEMIHALFSMTPYIHRTSKEGLKRLKELNRIDLTLSFLLLTYKKI